MLGFSAIICPVTVRQSPCSRPASSNAFITTGTPPMQVDVGHYVLAERRRCADQGTFEPTAVKSSSVSFHTTSCAMASGCRDRVGGSTERHHHRDAFSNASLVMMSRAVMPRLLRLTTAGRCARRTRHGGGRWQAGRAARQRHAKRLGGAGHRVGGVHAAAGTSRTDRALDGVDVFAASPAGAGADGLGMRR
jgi:hypothetical protein